MKLFINCLLITFLVFNTVHSQIVNGIFQVIENNGSDYTIKLIVNVEEGNFVLGNTAIRFTYNIGGLNFPQYPTENTDYVIHNLNSNDYISSVSQPSFGTLSINIANLTGSGISISTNYIDIATLYFTVINQSASANIQPALRQFFSPSSSSMWDLGTWESENTLLPVELISLDAVVSFDDVILEWTTATEINNLGFEIERITLASNIPLSRGDERGVSTKRGDESGVWTKIGFVEGNGTSTIEKNYSFTDTNPFGQTIIYRLKQIDLDGSFEYSNEITVNYSKMNFELYQNYPNPFNPTTKIKYYLPISGAVRLAIFNILGELIDNLINEIQKPGNYEVNWDASNLNSGVYFVDIFIGDQKSNSIFRDIKKMILVK